MEQRGGGKQFQQSGKGGRRKGIKESTSIQLEIPFNTTPNKRNNKLPKICEAGITIRDAARIWHVMFIGYLLHVG